MAEQNLNITAIDGERANRLFEAMAILDGLEAYAEREEGGDGICTTMLHMSRTAKWIISDVIAGMKP